MSNDGQSLVRASFVVITMKKASSSKLFKSPLDLLPLFPNVQDREIIQDQLSLVGTWRNRSPNGVQEEDRKHQANVLIFQHPSSTEQVLSVNVLLEYHEVCQAIRHSRFQDLVYMVCSHTQALDWIQFQQFLTQFRPYFRVKTMTSPRCPSLNLPRFEVSICDGDAGHEESQEPVVVNVRFAARWNFKK